MADEAKTKKKPSSGKKKLDDKKLSYIFFGLLIAGIIIATVVIVLKNTHAKYTASFGENITTTIELNTDQEEIKMVVKIGATEVTQKGKIQFLDKGEDEGEDGKKKWTIYEATLEPLTEDEEPEVVQIKVYDKSLILAYDSGETVEYTR